MTAMLLERRTDALARLDMLRRQRGAAVLDGETLDNNEITKAEHEIDALAQAEIEALRRERDDEATRLSDIARSLSGDLVEKEDARLAAIARAEQGAREMVAGLTKALEAAGEIRDLAQRLGKPSPATLGEQALVRRLSQHLVAVLSTLPGHRYRFGAVTWRSCWREAKDDWAACERAELSHDIDQIKQGR